MIPQDTRYVSISPQKGYMYNDDSKSDTTKKDGEKRFGRDKRLFKV